MTNPFPKSASKKFLELLKNSIDLFLQKGYAYSDFVNWLEIIIERELEDIANLPDKQAK